MEQVRDLLDELREEWQAEDEETYQTACEALLQEGLAQALGPVAAKHDHLNSVVVRLTEELVRANSKIESTQATLL